MTDDSLAQANDSLASGLRMLRYLLVAAVAIHMGAGLLGLAGIGTSYSAYWELAQGLGAAAILGLGAERRRRCHSPILAVLWGLVLARWVLTWAQGTPDDVYVATIDGIFYLPVLVSLTALLKTPVRWCVGAAAVMAIAAVVGSQRDVIAETVLGDLRLGPALFGVAILFALFARAWQRQNEELSQTLRTLESRVQMRTQMLSDAVSQRDLLLKELNHRTKNNLEVIASLFELQSSKMADGVAKQALIDGKHRVMAVATLHRDLSAEEGTTKAPFKPFVEALVQRLKGVYDPATTVDVDCADVVLGPQLAVPLALITNELMTNAFTHATQAHVPLRIAVNLSHNDGQLVLFVRDNGPGMSEPWDARRSSLGVTIISALSRQLRGEVRTDNSNGFHFTLTLPFTPCADTERRTS